ncbi:MAG TPA: hypothetical protein GXZ30_12685 [Propionibacterium sp.]|nr:hypothetical protein [Propionibacterium sp.]
MSQPPGFGGPSPQWPHGGGPGGPPHQPWPHQPQQQNPGFDLHSTQLYPTGQPPGGQQFHGAGTPPPTKGPRNTKKIVLIVIAALLALILAIVGILLFRNHQERVAEEEARVAAEQRKVEESRQATDAGATAEAFFEALAQSDADKALTFAAETPEGNNDLLTRDVLMEANKRAALTGVGVDETRLTEETPGVWNTGTATVSYSLGEDPQTIDLPLRRVGAEWKVDQVAAPVNLGLNGPDRLVNGVTVPPGAYNLFPGSYSVTSTNPLIGLDRTEFVLDAPTASDTDWEPEPVLSDEGRTRSIEAGRRIIDDCMKVKELQPENCRFILWEEQGLTIDRSSITYTLKNDPFQDVEFRFNGATMTATATVPVTNEIRATATQNGRRGTLVPTQQTNTIGIAVKLGSGTPEASFT